MLIPSSEAEVAEIITQAQGPLCIQGGGTRPIGAPVAGVVLGTSKLTGIELYEPGALTMVVKAGTRLDEVEQALAAEGQRLAFEPMDHRTLLGTTGAPTIGGIIAANVSGPRRIQVGAARDHLLGVRFVDGRGRVIKNGGRVMKNVTGYDLVKLMAGSYGTLGVLTEVSIKVLPKSECVGVVLIDDLTPVDAIRALSMALGSPFEVSGAAHTPSGVDGHPVTMIRVEGFENSVKYRLSELQKILAGFGKTKVELDPDRTAAGWQWVRDVEAFGEYAAVWRLSVKPSAALEVLDKMAQMHAYDFLLDWGGGLIWIGAKSDQLLQAAAEGEDGRNDDMADGIRVMNANLQHSAKCLAGHATMIKAPKELRQSEGVFPTLSPAVAALQAGLRLKFDPRAVLNPGLMGAAG